MRSPERRGDNNSASGAYAHAKKDFALTLWLNRYRFFKKGVAIVMNSLFVYSDRIYFVGKVKDLKYFLAQYMKKHLTLSELIKYNLH